MATEWERYTKGLVHDMSYFSAVKRAAQGVEERAVLLPAVWRRSDVDPPLDHVTVYEGLSAWCDVLIEAAEALKKRATDRGF